MLYANQYDSTLISNQKLKEISIVLKNGRTVQSKAMDLIFTILGCIVLGIDDHRGHLYEFKDVFSNRSLMALRNDLENLLHFNTRFFDYLILELILQTLKKESNNLDRSVRLNANGIVSGRRWNGMVIRRKVKAIVKFLIFRKTRTCSCLRDDDHTFDWSFYKQSIGVIFSNEINYKAIFAKNKTVFNKNRYSKCLENSYQINSTGQICFRNSYMDNQKNYLETRYNLNEASKYIYTQRFCSNVYRLLYCGWLWLFLCYFAMFFYSIFINIRTTI